MPHTTHAAPALKNGSAAGDLAITLTLSEDQLHAIGLNRLPAQGAEVHIRATAIVQHPEESEDTQDADHDGDRDSGEAGAGGTGARDAGARDAGAGDAGAGDADEEKDETGGSTRRAALTLHLSGLALTPARREPATALYGGGD